MMKNRRGSVVGMSLRGALWDKSLTWRGSGDSRFALQCLQEWQWRSEDEVAQVQSSRMSKLLVHASAHVPYYAEMLRDLGVVEASGNVRLDNFAKVPLLDKPIIRSNYEFLKSDDLDSRKWHSNTSGGSTGEPVRLVQDGEYWDWMVAGKRLYDSWSGYSVGQKKLVLWGSERDLFGGRESTSRTVGRWLKGEKWMNALRMGRDEMREYVQRLNRLRPVQILAYVESAYELARFIEEERLIVHSPASVMTSAGTLQPHMRTVIERVLGAPVFNRYGSREVGDPACECEVREGLHVSSPTHFVEILRPDGTPAPAGEVGELIVTVLTNFAMPLIRYRIGDMAAWSASRCRCGRGLPLLDKVVGRTNSIIRTPTRTFDSAGITSLLYYKDDRRSKVFSSFARYRFIQKRPDLMMLLVIVSDPDEWRDERTILERKLSAAFGDDVEIRIEEVERIDPSPSGKYAYVVSEV